MAETKRTDKLEGHQDWIDGIGATVRGLLDTAESLRVRIGILENKVDAIERRKWWRKGIK